MKPVSGCCCCCFALAQISRMAHPHEGSTCGSTTLSSFLYVSFSFAEFICNSYYGVGCFFQVFHIFLEYFLVFDGLPASFFYYWAHLEDVFLGLCFFFAESAYEVILHPFFKLFLTGSIDALVLIMAEHSFLFNFSIYIGLLSSSMSVLRSFQCFIFVFSTYSFSIRSMNLVFISSWKCFFKLVLVSTVIWSFTLNSSAILLIYFLHSILFGDVMSLMRASPFRLSIRLAWRIFFFFIVSSMG